MASPPEFPPLERRFIEVKVNGGGGMISKNKYNALNRRWAPNPQTKKWVEFYLPHPAADAPQLEKWSEAMSLYMKDLRRMLSLSHYAFWSSMVYCEAIRDQVLASFLRSAPRQYDPTYAQYVAHPVLWPVYEKLYLLVFRVYLRLSTFQESKEDYISQAYWSLLIRDNGLMTVEVLQNLCTLYYSESNVIFQKMLENVIKHDNRILPDVRAQVPKLRDKFDSLTHQTEELMSADQQDWDEIKLGDILLFTLDSMYSLLKFCQAYPPVTDVFLRYPEFLLNMAMSYEQNTKRWGRLISRLPSLTKQVNICRTAILRLYRYILITPTLNSVVAANDKGLDDYFEYFANSIDEKIFIHDYEKNYPFRTDMQGLLSRGIFVDETRIDYMANAISACFHSCGEEYSVEKIVVDPLYDPNFDRQLLGACSLELSGVELESLVSQVKDLLPELPSSYLEAVLKHYGYKTEDTINALLEGSVPARLEKYKSEEYIRSSQTTPTHISNKAIASTSASSSAVVSLPGEKFLPRKGAGNDTLQEQVLDSSTKSAILRLAEQAQEEARKNREATLRRLAGDGGKDEDLNSAYIGQDLLPPSFATDIDYEDEYDDTYDDVGAGMTEPDNAPTVFKPLNVKKAEIMGAAGQASSSGNNNYDEDDDDDDDDPSVPRRRGGGKDFEAFCEDPAVVRERFERRREEMYHRKHGGPKPGQTQYPSFPGQSQGGGQGGPPPGGQNRDVVGRAKGQGQEKDVLYNRRQKTANKGAGGNFKKRADFKRKEF